MTPRAENEFGSPVILFDNVNYDTKKKCLEVQAARNPAIEKDDLLKNIQPDDFGMVLVDGEINENVTFEEPLPVALV